jgi:hypothetical protein
MLQSSGLTKTLTRATERAGISGRKWFMPYMNTSGQ